ncbi:MAG TPA: hypothetical protein VGB63_10060 [Pedobacter sp.]
MSSQDLTVRTNATTRLGSMRVSIIVITLLFSSCLSTQKGLVQGKGSYEDALHNAIVNYTNKKSDFKAFEIFDFTDFTKDFYCFKIVPYPDKVILDTTKVIGNPPKYGFPTAHKIFDNKIFMWQKEGEMVTEDVVNALAARNLLDSTYVLVKQRKLPNGSSPTLTINESIKGTYYFICKKELTKMKKLSTAYRLKPEQYPRFNCP